MEGSRHTSTSSGTGQLQSGGSYRFDFNEVSDSIERNWPRSKDLFITTRMNYWKVGMSTSIPEPTSHARALSLSVTQDTVTVDLADGRSISVPLVWYPRLLHATSEERQNWRLIADGEGIHWSDLDEDISVENILAGQRSGESRHSLEKWLASRNGSGE